MEPLQVTLENEGGSPLPVLGFSKCPSLQFFVNGHTQRNILAQKSPATVLILHALKIQTYVSTVKCVYILLFPLFIFFYPVGIQSGLQHSLLLHFILRSTMWGQLTSECIVTHIYPANSQGRVKVWIWVFHILVWHYNNYYIVSNDIRVF